MRQARERGLSLTGPDGLLKQLTKTVLETALNEEMTEHLGYEKHDPAGRGPGNIRNGTRAKTVLTESTGQVGIEVPRDRAGTFEPQIVKKRQRRLSGVDEIVLSLYAKGLTTGEISAHFAEIYGASVSEGDDQPDHRQGDRGDEGLVGPAARRGADSSDRRESAGYEMTAPSSHDLQRGAVVQTFARPVVEFVGDLRRRVSLIAVEVGALRKVLPQAGRWCSRWCRVARVSAGRRSRSSCR